MKKLENMTNDEVYEHALELRDMLYTVLPYIEDAEKDPAYKPGAVAKVTAGIRALLGEAQS